MTRWTAEETDFTRFTMLYLNESGHFLDPDTQDEPRPVGFDELPGFFKRRIKLPPGVTDVFVWVHGWQNDELRAISTAKRLFAALDTWFKREAARYPKLESVVPSFVAVHWPSNSTPGPAGYRKIRNRARSMTTAGVAECFLASLLGYLDESNHRPTNRKVLKAKGGFYIHCLAHSFGGRFIAAAIQAAAEPSAQKRVLAAAHRTTRFEFNVDSLCVLQMAAGATSFGKEFSSLLDTGPLVGPIVLTHSESDRALCLWHALSEGGEVGIGCAGAQSPPDRIGSILMQSIEQPYSNSAFSKDLTNVDASSLYTEGGWLEGGHSDFWHEETIHLIASVVEQCRPSTEYIPDL